MTTPELEWTVASRMLPGETESGDRHVVVVHEGWTLLAVIDGIGHGAPAAAAAHTAREILSQSTGQDIIALVRQCHAALRETRGAVLSLALFDMIRGQVTWLGVGNVAGVLARAATPRTCDALLLRGGVVGDSLPALQVASLPVAPGDILVLATDGVAGEFVTDLRWLPASKVTAASILERYGRDDDDALVLVARYMGRAA